MLLATAVGAQASRGVVIGVVRDSGGSGISSAHVQVEGTDRRATTGPDGSFRLERVPRGLGTLQVRRLGFRPATVTFLVEGAGEARVEVALVPVAALLPAVEIRERPEVFDARLRGFNERRHRGNGYFITRERLERVHSYRFIDIMREVPGVRVGMLRGAATVRMRGASCDPLVFLDGFPAAAGAVDLDMIDLGLVEGIEVYSGLASIPPEFISVRGTERCGVVAIWTRPYRATSRGGRGEPADLERLVADREVFTAEQVDAPAALAPGTAAPIYPDSLWRARVPGRVLVELVVDPSGVMQRGTLRIVSSTHPSFTSAVRVALDVASFRPATHGGRRVPQLVLLPFIFSAEGVSTGSSGPPPVPHAPSSL